MTEKKVDPRKLNHHRVTAYSKIYKKKFTGTLVIYGYPARENSWFHILNEEPGDSYLSLGPPDFVTLVQDHGCHYTEERKLKLDLDKNGNWKFVDPIKLNYKLVSVKNINDEVFTGTLVAVEEPITEDSMVTIIPSSSENKAMGPTHPDYLQLLEENETDQDFLKEHAV